MPFWKALQYRALIGRESSDLHGAGDHGRELWILALTLSSCDTTGEGWDAGNPNRGRSGAVGAGSDWGRLVHGLKGSGGVVRGLEGYCKLPTTVHM